MIGNNFEVSSLGQAGYRIKGPKWSLYIDPYLSNSVQCLEGARSQRLIPIVIAPSKVNDATHVLITHKHLDHCDPETIVPLAESSPYAKFMAPACAIDELISWGIPASRCAVAEEKWEVLAPSLSVCAVPAAHPEIVRDDEGRLEFVGYVFDIDGRRVYHAGDTGVDPLVVNAVRALGPIHLAFIPVNEQNYYKRNAGIVGNMSVREAFQFAEAIGAERVVPSHWDMFASNRVFREEIELLYRLLAPRFEMLIDPEAD